MRSSGRQADDLIAALHSQLEIMQGQLDLMTQDQEPHFLIAKGKFEGPLFKKASDHPEFGVIGWNVPYINSGKGRATDVVVNSYFSVDGGAFVRSNSRVRNDPFQMDDVLPQGDGFFTVFSQFTTEAEFNRLRAKDLGIAIFFEFAYSDRAAKHYTNAHCFALYANGAVANLISAECRKHLKEQPSIP